MLFDFDSMAGTGKLYLQRLVSLAPLVIFELYVITRTTKQGLKELLRLVSSFWSTLEGIFAESWRSIKLIVVQWLWLCI